MNSFYPTEVHENIHLANDDFGGIYIYLLV